MRGVDRHSRLVAWAKVVLPLAALGLLSSLFLFADRIDPERAVRQSPVDVDALAREPRMTQPDYAGITLDGTIVNVTATVARPATPEREAEAETARADLSMPGGGTAAITAPRLRLDSAGGMLVLSGGVNLTSSSGYTVNTEGLLASLDRTSVSSAGPVEAVGPAGTLQAGAFRLTATEADGEAATTGEGSEGGAGQSQTGAADSASRGPSYVMLFSGGVRLLYRPEATAQTPGLP